MSDYLRQSQIEQELLQCVVCSQRPVDAKLLDCLHAACSQCLHGIVDESTVTCPSCEGLTKLVGGVMALTDHHVSSTLSQAAGQGEERPSCDECDENEGDAAVAYCRTCRLQLCDLHANGHRRSRRTKHHQLDDVKEAERREDCCADRTCRLHGRTLDVFCVTCRRVICSECAPHGHSRHTKAAWTEELADQARQRLEQFVQNGKTKAETVSQLQKISEEAKQRKEGIKRSAEATSDTISAHFDKLRQTLADKEDELLASLGREQRALTEPFEKIHVESKKLLRAFELAHSVAEGALGNTDKRVPAEQEGPISGRVDLLTRQAQELADISAQISSEHPHRSSFVFNPSSAIDTVAMNGSSGGLVGVMTLKDFRASRVVDGEVKVDINASVENVTGLESVDESKLKSMVDNFAFQLSPSYEVMAAASAPASSDCSQHLCTVVRSAVQLSKRSDKVELNVACTLHSDGGFGDGGDIVVELQSEVIGRCSLPQANQEGIVWRFAREEFPTCVELSEDGKKVWKTKNTYKYDLLVGETEFSSGVHVWKAEALADDNAFDMLAGVTTLKKHGEIEVNDKKHFIGWHRGSWAGGTRSKAIVQGVYSGQVVDNSAWNQNDILLFQLDFTKGTLNVTNTTTGWSDTIRGITCPVHPCFGFPRMGRGARLLPCSSTPK